MARSLGQMLAELPAKRRTVIEARASVKCSGGIPGRARKMEKQMKIAVTDADGLADNTAPVFLLMNITRPEVEAGNIASVLERLHILTDSLENVLLYHESLAFQVSGYDNDPRELPEIPEVRRYFRRLAAEWPHWLWFLARGTGSIPLMLALLCRVNVIRDKNRPGSFGTAFESAKELQDVLQDLFHRGNALFDAYPVSDDMLEKSAESAVKEVL